MGGLVQHPKAQGGIAPPMGISAGHKFEGFDCGKAPLNDWLTRHARKNEGRASRTYVVCDNEGKAIGYYALATGSVSHDNAPKALKANRPNPTSLMVIGRLAVDKNYQGKGLGADLLRDALSRALNASRIAGARAVIVHVKDDDVVPFYAGFGFLSFPDDSRRMFITMKSIEAAL